MDPSYGSKEKFELKQNLAQINDGQKEWKPLPPPEGQKPPLPSGPPGGGAVVITVTQDEEGTKGCFKWVKITLLVIHILCAILLALALVLYTWVYVMLIYSEDLNQDMSESVRQDLNMKMYCVFVAAFGLIFEVVVIVGIIKENMTVIIIYLILSAIGYGINRSDPNGTGIMPLIVICLTAYLAYKINKRDRHLV